MGRVRISSESRDETLMTLLPIRRSPSGVYEGLNADVVPPGTQAAGWFTFLFQRRKPWEDDIEAARLLLSYMDVAVPDPQ